MKKETYDELRKWLILSTDKSMQAFLQFIRKNYLTIQQMNLLMYLFYHGPCETTHLVEPLQIGKSAVSQMVERLVAMNLLKRVEMLEDRRVRRLELTGTAQQLIENGIAARQQWLTEINPGLAKDEEALIAAALTILNRVYSTESEKE
jgi:DNA-binding MarR family transcriptional regulator